MVTSYADGAQAREWDRRYDDYGRPKKATADEFHDYEAVALMRSKALSERTDRERENRKSLKQRIGLAMAQMEEICPPKGGAA
jgi:hypothetical protein